MSDFLAMGGYAKYVWSAYSISLVVLIFAVVLTKRALANMQMRIIRRRTSLQEQRS